MARPPLPPVADNPPAAAAEQAVGAPAAQQVVKVRRDYNTWVATETLEDYALRFTPRSARRWSEARVANTAFGAASFLILEAVGATLLVQYGFINAFWAILATGLIISIFQAATQINEQTLSFVPKLIATFITLVLAGPWMITMMTDFIRRLFESIPSMIG